MSCYVHNVPGRLRIRASSLKHHHQDAFTLCKKLEKADGIDKTEFNPKAGSLIIYYDVQQLGAEDILYQLHKTDLLKGCPTSTHHHSASRMGTMLGSALFGTLVKKSIETSVLSIAKAIR